jgi:hypothetical protein
MVSPPRNSRITGDVSAPDPSPSPTPSSGTVSSSAFILNQRRRNDRSRSMIHRRKQLVQKPLDQIVTARRKIRSHRKPASWFPAQPPNPTIINDPRLSRRYPIVWMRATCHQFTALGRRCQHRPTARPYQRIPWGSGANPETVQSSIGPDASPSPGILFRTGQSAPTQVPAVPPLPCFSSLSITMTSGAPRHPDH